MNIYFYECFHIRSIKASEDYHYDVKVIKPINSTTANEYEISKKLIEFQNDYYIVKNMQVLREEKDGKTSNKFIFTYNKPFTLSLSDKAWIVTSMKQKISECIHEYIHLLKLLQKLHSMNIAFCNIHSDNIVFSCSRPIFRNFLLSIDYHDAKRVLPIKNIEKRILLPPEIYMYKEGVCDETFFSAWDKYGLSPDFVKRSYDMFQKNDEPIITEETITLILPKWDIYSLSLLYIGRLREVFLQEYYHEKHENIFPNDKTMIHFYHALLQNIHVDYTRRWTFEKTIQYLSVYY
jgi:hypothetical protein